MALSGGRAGSVLTACVIGWAMAAIQDETLIETALCMALLGRQPSPGLLFHSDRGSQYTSGAYRAVLAQATITASMSRTGNCYDNAVTESFFGTLKGECVERMSFHSGSTSKREMSVLWTRLQGWGPVGNRSYCPEKSRRNKHSWQLPGTPSTLS